MFRILQPGPGLFSVVGGDALTGLPGEAAGLRFIERSRLEPGRLMLYRMRRDVHVQLPPDRFSVSLNVLGYDPAQPWTDQYRYDIRNDVIAEGLTVAPGEALLALAVHLGGGNGMDLAHDFAARHPSARMRLTALDALASGEDGAEARAAVYEAAAGSPHGYVAGMARQRIARCLAP